MTPDIRKERETALYEAALRLIAKGVNPAAMKVQQIADEAGIGKGTVYEYFASKDEILQGMALYCFDTEIARIAVLICKFFLRSYDIGSCCRLQRSSGRYRCYGLWGEIL